MKWITSSLIKYAKFRVLATAFRRQYTYKQLYNLISMPVHVVYPSLQSVLDMFQEDKFKTDANVIELLNIYKDCESKAKVCKKNHPLIVLEGLDLSGKTTLSKLLSAKINAVNLKNPPACIKPELRAAFDNHCDLKSAFYTLGNYIAAFEVQQTLETKPVVLDRFWYSTVANSLARAVQAHPQEFILPARGNIVYRWPADLLQPDLVLFLSVSERERQKRQENRVSITKEELMLRDNHSFRQNVLLAYQYMEDPPISMVNSDLPLEETLDLLLSTVKKIIPQ